MKTATRRQNAYSLFELLAVTFMIGLIAMAYLTVRVKYGFAMAVLASVAALLKGALLVLVFYCWLWIRHGQKRIRLREKYRTIYRLKELPTEIKSVVKPDGAEIQIGDYGWDARPVRNDGLIHLQGLTKQWQVVWHAGFRTEQIEKITEKPVS